MGNMQVVAQQQLQRMFACCERYLGGRAAVPEVNVVCVGRNRQPWIRQVGIDEKVMMARMHLLVASVEYCVTKRLLQIVKIHGRGSGLLSHDN